MVGLLRNCLHTTYDKANGEIENLAELKADYKGKKYGKKSNK